jgi:hypothetical protein
MTIELACMAVAEHLIAAAVPPLLLDHSIKRLPVPAKEQQYG